MKYSIIISNISNDIYAIVCKAYKVSEEGQQYDVKSLNTTAEGILKSAEIAQQFVKDNG